MRSPQALTDNAITTLLEIMTSSVETSSRTQPALPTLAHLRRDGPSALVNRAIHTRDLGVTALLFMYSEEPAYALAVCPIGSSTSLETHALRHAHGSPVGVRWVAAPELRVQVVTGIPTCLSSEVVAEMLRKYA